MDEHGLKIARNSVFDCHLSPFRWQMAIKNSVSNDFWSTFVDSINVLDCRLSGMWIVKKIFVMSPGACVPELGCVDYVMTALIAPRSVQHNVVDLHQIFDPDLDLAHVTLDLDLVTCEACCQSHRYRVPTWQVESRCCWPFRSAVGALRFPLRVLWHPYAWEKHKRHSRLDVEKIIQIFVVSVMDHRMTSPYQKQRTGVPGWRQPWPESVV